MSARTFGPYQGEMVTTQAKPNGSKAMDVSFYVVQDDGRERLLHVDQLIPARPGERAEVLGRLGAAAPSEAEAIVEEAGTHLLTLAAELVDDDTKERQEDSGQGVPIELSDPEPATTPVDLTDLLDRMERALGRYVILGEHSRRAVALWIVFTYVHDAFDTSPILALVSPTKRCGKTTLLGIIEAMVRRPLAASNTTPAALFRVIGKQSPTVLLDELDTLFQANDDHGELRGMLNSGHSRPSAFVLRTVGEDFEPRRFPTWCPKVFAKIGDLPDTLNDRSVVVPMDRKLPTDRVERIRFSEIGTDFDLVRRQAMRWALDHIGALRGADPEVPEALNDRAGDNWRPLLAIADLAGREWPEYARKAALVLSGDLPDDDEGGTAEHQLLADLAAYCAEHTDDHLRSADLCEWLRARDERPWRTWGKDSRGLTPRHLARLLRPFRIRPTSVRAAEGTPKGYVREQILAVHARYLPSYPQQAQHESTTTTYAASASATGSEALRIENGPNSLNINDVADVADGEPPTGTPDLFRVEIGADWEVKPL